MSSLVPINNSQAAQSNAASNSSSSLDKKSPELKGVAASSSTIASLSLDGDLPTMEQFEVLRSIFTGSPKASSAPATSTAIVSKASSVAETFKFKALPTFAKIDQVFINTPLLANVVDTRYAVKCLQVNTQEASDVAKTTLISIGNRADKACAYVERKIDGFSNKTKSKELAAFTEETATTVENATIAFYNACSDMYKSDEATKLFDEQTVERKKYKEEITELLKQLYKEDANLNTLEERAKAIVRSACQDLPAVQRTKDYLIYKVGYMFDEFSKNRT